MKGVPLPVPPGIVAIRTSEIERIATEARSLDREINEAADRALESLSRYKFAMFGYWAGIWVHLNRIEGRKRPSPFKALVLAAREIQRSNDELRYS